MGAEVSAATYYTSLLTWVGCARYERLLSCRRRDALVLGSHDAGYPRWRWRCSRQNLGYGTSNARSACRKFLATVRLGGEGDGPTAILLSIWHRLELGDSVRHLIQAFRLDGRVCRVARDGRAAPPSGRALADNIEGSSTGGLDAASSRHGAPSTQFDP